MKELHGNLALSAGSDGILPPTLPQVRDVEYRVESTEVRDAASRASFCGWGPEALETLAQA